MNIKYVTDADINAWEYYRIIYKDEIQIDLDKLVDTYGRWIGTFVYEDGKMKTVQKNNQNNSLMELSGECLFNFNEKKHKLFMEVIQNSNVSEDEKRRAEKDLIICESRFNCASSPWNFVLMPVCGAMNNVKGNIYYSIKNERFAITSTKAGKRFDRPDTFLTFLDDFYEMKKEKYSIKEIGEFLSCSIFTYSLKSFNFPILFDFMCQFKSTEQFCKLFWGIDKTFVKRMRELGRMPMDSDKSMGKKCKRELSSIEVLMEYMKIAQDYWNYREKEFRKIQKLNI